MVMIGVVSVFARKLASLCGDWGVGILDFGLRMDNTFSLDFALWFYRLINPQSAIRNPKSKIPTPQA
jgi:hypothetical protein